MNNKEKVTEIIVKIDFGLTHSNPTEEAQQRIERTSLYINSLFSVIREMVMVTGEFPSAPTREERRDINFNFGHIELLSEMGKGFSDAIYEFVNQIPDPKTLAESIQITDPDTIEPETEDDMSAMDTVKTGTIALALSAILHNPSLPVPVYNAFMNALDNLRNEMSADDRLSLEENETTSQYLLQLLRVFKK